MTMVVFRIRAFDLELPVFFHVLGAMVLVGGMIAVVVALALAWRRTDDRESAALVRFAFRSLLFAVLPGFVVMRAAAQWAFGEMFPGVGFGEEPDWVGVGYVVADPGSVVLVATIVLTWLAARRASRGEASGRLVPVAAVLATLLLAAYLAVTFAMTAKPG
ncbi:MAG: hypothetical protein M3123_01445 [Actinomycetota bacterium]|nr:hypothetical protein [Actinomycetota bacterium]